MEYLQKKHKQAAKTIETSKQEYFDLQEFLKSELKSNKTAEDI